MILVLTVIFSFIAFGFLCGFLFELFSKTTISYKLDPLKSDQCCNHRSKSSYDYCFIEEDNNIVQSVVINESLND